MGFFRGRFGKTPDFLRDFFCETFPYQISQVFDDVQLHIFLFLITQSILMDLNLLRYNVFGKQRTMMMCSIQITFYMRLWLSSICAVLSIFPIWNVLL